MARRVHQLAKELGVKSNAIVAKCQDEGLDVKNHMTTLSAGLEATIREWFSEGEHNLTVETTARVDLDKVRDESKRKRKKKAEESSVAVEELPEDASDEDDSMSVEQGSDSDTEIVAEPVAAEESDTTPAVVAEEASDADAKADLTRERPKRISPQERDDVDTANVAAEQPAVEQAETEVIEPAAARETAPTETEPETAEQAAAAEAPATDETTTESPEQETPPAEPAEQPIRMLKPHEPKAAKAEPVPFVPKPAVLQGPQVIRVERPEATTAPPSRPPRRRPAPAAQQAPSAVPQPSDSDAKGRGKRGRKTGTAINEGEEALRKGKRSSQRRRGGRFGEETTPHWGDRDLQERQERLAQASASKLHGRERRLAQQEKGGGFQPKPRKIDKAAVKEPITVKDLSQAIGVRSNEIIGKLMGTGVMATINQSLDADSAIMVALEFGVELTVERETPKFVKLQEEFDNEIPSDQLQPRPPVVAFLGHVDHGKTSLLDQIRKSQVAHGEAGGITQHIGSYLYDDGNRRVTFLDTPGHKAFTAMRARGANMTDIVVLVVAADDGVMPQTEEAINHAKAAGVSIVVALNKIDVPNADINKVLGQLSEKGLIPAEWGGDTEIVKTSAATGEGIDDLVEHLDYIAELNDLKAKADGPATGWIIEAQMDPHLGVTARLLVKHGGLQPGDALVSSSSYGRVRTLRDATGKNLKQAGPAMPVIVTGLDGVPTAGDRFFVTDDITQAKSIAEEERARERDERLASRRQVTLENLFSEIAAGELKELNVIVKADVQGSVDVLVKAVQEMNTEEVAVRVLHAGVGGISESDVLLAEASGAIIIGFQVVADDHARALAEKEGVQIRLYRVIYQITDDIRAALEGLLEPQIEQKEMGRAEVRQIFKISRLGTIAGCYVTSGQITRSVKCRLIRDSIVIRDDMELQSLKRNKDDVNEVRNGFECGLKFEGFDDIKVGDVIEAFEMVEVARTLDTAGSNKE